jgi:hypothetical protein
MCEQAFLMVESFAHSFTRPSQLVLSVPRIRVSQRGELNAETGIRGGGNRKPVPEATLIFT